MFSIMAQLIFRAIIEKMIFSDYVLCYIPRALGILGKSGIFGIYQEGDGAPFDVSGGLFEVFKILGKKSKIWNLFPEILKILSYNFQSRKQILTLRGVYSPEKNKKTFLSHNKRPALIFNHNLNSSGGRYTNLFIFQLYAEHPVELKELN